MIETYSNNIFKNIVYIFCFFVFCWKISGFYSPVYQLVSRGFRAKFWSSKVASVKTMTPSIRSVNSRAGDFAALRCCEQRLKFDLNLNTLPETDISTWKYAFPKGKLSFNHPIFRCRVNLRHGILATTMIPRWSSQFEKMMLRIWLKDLMLILGYREMYCTWH